MATDVLEVKIKVRVHGLWRVALLGWAIKLWRLRPEHVTIEIPAELHGR